MPNSMATKLSSRAFVLFWQNTAIKQECYRGSEDWLSRVRNGAAFVDWQTTHSGLGGTPARSRQRLLKSIAVDPEVRLAGSPAHK